MAAELKSPIDERVLKKLRSLVNEGIQNPKEMQRHLKILVKGIFVDREMPRIINRRFFPSKEDIRKLIYQQRRKSVHSLIDQEDLAEKIRVWKDERPDDSWTLRLSSFVKRPLNEDEEDEDVDHCMTTDDERFLVVYQSAWQRRLLQRYGKELVYVDATYRTTKYALPLFFVCVQTNCGYSVVASFVLEKEDSTSIAEALRIIQENNLQWTCGSYMIDFSEVEANAISRVFPEANIFICDFHRKQAWLRWTTASKHDVTSQEETLHLLNMVAESCSIEEYNDNLKKLQNSEAWRNNLKLQQYIQNQWLANDKHKMWVWLYRGSNLTLVSNTNNGVEAQNKVFKYEYFAGLSSRTVSSLMTALIEDFFVDSYRNESVQLIPAE
ncbi:uncharacterized protein LOC117320120 [Pecten maximus]|uniref:uncharacterized protein LOC117320120 n=1 Tax=Pecten maximus TaxID=6579 RepID=UPI001458A009|nr:uncharacterized protein LOC117320120 [Pecten maximus]